MSRTNPLPTADQIAALSSDVLLMLGSCAALIELARTAADLLKRSKWVRRPRPVRKGAGDGRWASTAAGVAVAPGDRPNPPRRWFKFAHEFAIEIAEWYECFCATRKRVESNREAFRQAATQLPSDPAIGISWSAHEAAIDYALGLRFFILAAATSARSAARKAARESGQSVAPLSREEVVKSPDMEEFVRYAPEIAAALVTESPKPPQALIRAIQRESTAASGLLGTTKPKTPRRPTVWYHGTRSYSADGLNPITVTVPEDLALAWFKKNDCSATTAQLRTATSVDTVSSLMKSLAKKFPGRVSRPGKKKKGAGYYVRVRPAG